MQKIADMVFGYSQVGNETDRFHAAYMCFVVHLCPHIFG